MTDYIKASGEGELMIRDLGSTVEFWVRAGYSNFWWDSLDFNTTVSGSTIAVAINYPTGGAWKKVTSRSVTTSQTVTFRLLQATGTESLAGPTTFSQFLDRGARPDPPSTITYSSIEATSVVASFSDGDNNGVAIDSREIRYRRNTVSTTEGTVSSDRSTLITGLVRGATYVMSARTHNAKGWSDWGASSSVILDDVPDPPSKVAFANVAQTSVDVTFTDGANGNVAIDFRQIAYNLTNTTTGATVVSSDRSTTLTGLSPGRTYYVWARAHNLVGYSGWSPVNSVTLVAGAYVKVGTTWKRAVPWVKVSGVWKVARPWSRIAGIWKKSL